MTNEKKGLRSEIWMTMILQFRFYMMGRFLFVMNLASSVACWQFTLVIIGKIYLMFHNEIIKLVI